MGNTNSSPGSSAFSVPAQYQALSPLGKEIIRFLAIAYAAVTQTFLLDCLQEIKDELGLPLQPPLETHFKATLALLIGTGLVKKGKQGRLTCHQLLRDIPCREAVKAGRYDQLADIVNKHEAIGTVGYSDRRNFFSEDHFLREVRIGIYRQDLKFVKQQFQDYYYYSSYTKLSISGILVQTINNPFDAEWLRNLKPELLSLALNSLLLTSLTDLTPADDAFEILKDFVFNEKTITDETLNALLTLIEQLFFLGELEDLTRLIKRMETTFTDLSPGYSFIAQGHLSLLQGQYAEAIAGYQTALKGLRRLTGKRKIYFPDSPGILCLFALMGEGSAESLNAAQDFIKITQKEPFFFTEIYDLFYYLIQWLKGDRNAHNYLALRCDCLSHDISVLNFVKLLISYWLQKDVSSQWLDKAKSFYQESFRADYQWFAMIIS